MSIATSTGGYVTLMGVESEMVRNIHTHTQKKGKKKNQLCSESELISSVKNLQRDKD